MFRKGSQVRQTPEEGRRTYQLKRCGNNNEDEDNSPKTLNDKKRTYLDQLFNDIGCSLEHLPGTMDGRDG